MKDFIWRWGWWEIPTPPPPPTDSVSCVIVAECTYQSEMRLGSYCKLSVQNKSPEFLLFAFLENYWGNSVTSICEDSLRHFLIFLYTF